jgi:DNA-binding transcriptional MerR regulator
MNQGQYLIEELCRLTGFSRRTVRYYVQEGLVDPPAGRGRGGYYSDLQVAQLARIHVLQEQGYRLDAIRGMLAPQATAETAEAAEPTRESMIEPGTAAEPTADAPRSSLQTTTSQASPHSSWTRHVVARGVELHISAEAGSHLGPAVATALEALRSIIGHEGGLNG